MQGELMRQIEEIDEEIKSTQRQISESQGTVNTIMQRIKQEFECDSLKEAKAKLEEMKVESDQQEVKFEHMYEALVKAYAEFKKVKAGNE